MSRLFFVVAFALGAALFGSGCRAADAEDVDPSISFVSGGFARSTGDILAEGGLEVRSAPIVDHVGAMAGFTVVEGGGLYYYAGLRWPFEVFDSERWFLTPSFAAGVYDNRDNDQIDLGGPIEFRTALELSYALNKWLSVGLYVAHLSNASIYDKNGGAETAGIALTLDFFRLIRGS